ncbi:MAG: hypothetical protein K2O88_08045 [Paramuribaculum sp.]|nr:hypothetical protein [Paramuribaculum sp.]
MFSRLHLNLQSRQLINNIWMNAKNHPMYADYNVIKDEASYADAGAIAIRLDSPRGAMNMFLFYPAYDGSGKIGSCAIYGGQLEGHKNAIERSMKLFGLPVESVEWDEGYERFLDVTLKEY